MQFSGWNAFHSKNTLNNVLTSLTSVFICKVKFNKIMVVPYNAQNIDYLDSITLKYMD